MEHREIAIMEIQVLLDIQNPSPYILISHAVNAEPKSGVMNLL